MKKHRGAFGYGAWASKNGFETLLSPGCERIGAAFTDYAQGSVTDAGRLARANHV